jgi:hypothetical protein
LHRKEIESMEGIVIGVETEKEGTKREEQPLLERGMEVVKESVTEMCGTEMMSHGKERFSLQLKKLSLEFMEGLWTQIYRTRSLMKMRRAQAP